MSDFTIKELSESDWREYKSIRLKSLQDSPDSFGSTYERESSFTPEQWKSRLRISPDIYDAVALAAMANYSFVGLISSMIHAPDSPNAHIYQMWVAPDNRGMGIATSLVYRIKTWAIGKSVDKLTLSVTTINSDAISLYDSIGFISTGITEPLRIGSSLKSQTMELHLNTSDD